MSAPPKFGLAAAAALVAMLIGCAHAPLSYQLVRKGSSTLMIPPTEPPAGGTTSEIRIKGARKQASPQTACDIEDSLLTLHWKGRTADVSFRPETYVPEPGNQVAALDSEGLKITPLESLYLAPQQDLDTIRNELLNLSAKGCLTSREDRQLVRTLVEELPLPPDLAYSFAFGAYGLTDEFDLSSDFRLQVISPVYAPGATPSARQLIGHETANYVFISARNDDRVKVALDSVTETDLGQATPFQKSAPQNALSFPPSFAFFRMLFKSNRSAADQIRLAILISAGDKSKLDEASGRVQSSAGDPCEQASAFGATCLAFPQGWGVNAQMRIRVNGKESFVRVGGTLSETIDESGLVNAVPKDLAVRRPFRGRLVPVKFDPATRDILNLVLMPGDEITW